MKERGRDTKNPISQPSNHAAIRCTFTPTLIRLITRDINKAMTTDMTDPKKRICLIVIPYRIVQNSSAVCWPGKNGIILSQYA
jgi:hypothetical protein